MRARCILLAMLRNYYEWNASATKPFRLAACVGKSTECQCESVLTNISVRTIL